MEFSAGLGGAGVYPCEGDPGGARLDPGVWLRLVTPKRTTRAKNSKNPWNEA